MMEASLMRHELCLCTGADALAQRTVPFVEEGFEAGEPVIAVLHEQHGAALRDGLGAGADALTLIDPDEHYSRPEAALASYDATLRRLIGGGAPGVRLVGELPTIRTAAEWDRWAAYDAILNRAFAHHPVWMVCVYDTETLPEHAVRAARCTHPVAFGAAGRPNEDYLPPDDVVRARTPATAPLDGLEALEVDGDGAELRRRLGVALDAAGVEPEDGGGMLLAVGEVYNNARRHAGGRHGRAGRRGQRPLRVRGPRRRAGRGGPARRVPASPPGRRQRRGPVGRAAGDPAARDGRRARRPRGPPVGLSAALSRAGRRP
jgi:hypothetical protein